MSGREGSVLSRFRLVSSCLSFLPSRFEQEHSDCATICYIPAVTDTLSPGARSQLMSRVRSRGTTPELKVRRLLHAAGLRFRLHQKDLPGKPDIVLPRHRFAVFVHGCFWHGHSCNRGRRPSSNRDFWDAKLDRNILRDSIAQNGLLNAGWHVATIWECQLNADTLRLITRLRDGRSAS